MALRPELASLVQYVELNGSRWWDRAIERLIVAAAWRLRNPATPHDILEELERGFRIHLDPPRLQRRIDSLASTGGLVRLPEGTYKISEQGARQFQEHLDSAGALENATKGRFLDILQRDCPTIAVETTWDLFNAKFLIPLVRDVGATTYQLLLGKGTSLEKVPFDAFLKNFDSGTHSQLRSALKRFLDPKDPHVRAHLLRLLNAYFVVEASSVPQTTLDAFAEVTKQKPSFTLFLDTNFLLCLLGLQENPSNEAVQSLLSLVKQIAGRVTVKLYVLTHTIDETKRVLTAKERSVRELALAPNLLSAIPEEDVGGILFKFFQEVEKSGYSLTAQTYFGPYIHDLVPIMQDRGVEHYNDPLIGYGKDQSVVDDIMSKLEAQTRLETEGRLIGRRKTYEQLQHDMIMWHFVSRRRSSQVESPVDAKYWVVTIDYGLIGFDSYKTRQLGQRVPVCIHPATLVQMLQFWVPRTLELEEALVGSIRLPFLFEDFDAEAERVTIRILAALTRFSNVGDLPTETVASILVNDALRQKLESESVVDRHVVLVREALVDQNRAKEMKLREVGQKAARLEGQLTQQSQQLDERTRQLRHLEEKLDRQHSELTEATTRLGQEIESRQSLEARIEELSQTMRDRDERNADSIARRAFVIKWFVLPMVLVFGFGWLSARLLSGFTTLTQVELRSLLWVLGFAIVVVIADVNGVKRAAVRSWNVFEKIRRLKFWILALVGAIVVDILSDEIRALFAKL
jgi:hypothetical protein